MGQQTDRYTKQILQDLLRGSLGMYDSDAANVLRELLENEFLEIRVVEDERFHAKIYNFYLTDGPNPDDTWNGSANFSSSGLSRNIELSMPVQTTFESRRRIRSWFDKLWEKATPDLDILETLNEAQEGRSIYYSPKTFFAAIIAVLDKDYLLEDAPGTSKEQLLDFQDFSYRIVMSRLETYGGYILANSVGTGKTYVAGQVAKTYLRSRRVGPDTEGRVLAVVPNTVIEEWNDTLAEFEIQDEVDVISMGQFQKTHRSEADGSVPTFDERSYSEEYRLIIVDEAHNYRNNSNRRNNLERVIRSNPAARVLLLSATPINLSPNDLFQLIDLFRNGARQNRFEKHELHQHYIETRARFKGLDDYEDFDRSLLNDIRQIEHELSLKLTWRILANEYEHDLRALGGEDVAYYEPAVEEVPYSYPHSYRRNIFDEIVPFLEDLNYESAKLAGGDTYDPDKNVIFFRKWRLYKQLESSIVAFDEGLRNLYDRTRLYHATLRNRQALTAETPAELVEDLSRDRVNHLLGGDLDRLHRFTEGFESVTEDTREEILRRMSADVERVREMMERVERYAGDATTVPRNNDTKAEQFVRLIADAVDQDQPILVFSEFVATVEYLAEVVQEELPDVNVGAIHGQTNQSKENFVDAFQSGEYDVAITTELLAEGVNLPRADVVINYDLPYNPTALIQRLGRALRITNPKQIYVRNFTPTGSIDRELELYDTLDARLENIVQIAGLDFVVWMMDEERIDSMRSQEQEEYLEHLQEYKQSLSSANPSETLDDERSARDPIDIALEQAIEEHNIDASLIDRVPIPNSKPIYTTLQQAESSGLGVIGQIGNTTAVWSSFQRSVSGSSSVRGLTDADWTALEDLVEEREAAVLREQTTQGNLGRTGEIHALVRDARDRLTDGDMRVVLTDVLTGLENNTFRPEEEDAVKTTCETILDYPTMVRNIDESVAQRESWQRLKSLVESAGDGSDDGVNVAPIAIAKYIEE
nr:helicase-related protein [Haladaptatus halobius]